MHGRAPEWEWKGGQAGGRHTNEVSDLLPKRFGSREKPSGACMNANPRGQFSYTLIGFQTRP